MPINIHKEPSWNCLRSSHLLIRDFKRLLSLKKRNLHLCCSNLSKMAILMQQEILHRRSISKCKNQYFCLWVVLHLCWNIQWKAANKLFSSLSGSSWCLYFVTHHHYMQTNICTSLFRNYVWNLSCWLHWYSYLQNHIYYFNTYIYLNWKESQWILKTCCNFFNYGLSWVESRFQLLSFIYESFQICSYSLLWDFSKACQCTFGKAPGYNLRCMERGFWWRGYSSCISDSLV